MPHDDVWTAKEMFFRWIQTIQMSFIHHFTDWINGHVSAFNYLSGAWDSLLNRTFASNKLSDLAASSWTVETSVRYRMMLEYTLHSNLLQDMSSIFLFLQAKYFHCLWALILIEQWACSVRIISHWTTAVYMVFKHMQQVWHAVSHCTYLLDVLN